MSKCALSTGKYIALVGIPSTLGAIGLTILFGLVIGALGC